MLAIRQSVDIKVGPKQVPAEIISFDGLASGKEHVALRFNREATGDKASTLVRVHSECLTGDIFHSSRCDCGEQLNEAIQRLDQAGGVLLYLRQEGRGIGLYNKLDAYVLQDQGLDTYAANVELGFAEDSRDFTEAAEMLKALNIHQIELITNNPKKTQQLAAHGIDVVATRNTSVHQKSDNAGYLRAKQALGQHELTLADDDEAQCHN
jgi:GTP cyclohydrolase II